MFTLKNVKRKSKSQEQEIKATILLPKPVLSGIVSIEKALFMRRSIREYRNEIVPLKEISQLMWAAQGVTGDGGRRTTPSAGALFPLEVYLVAANVDGLAPGVYHYNPTDHSLELIAKGDKRKQLAAAALLQGSVHHCAATIVFAAHVNFIVQKYFERGENYVYIEAGHATQNVLLQAIPLHIGCVTVGAFIPGVTKKILHLPENEDPLYLLPLGKM